MRLRLPGRVVMRTSARGWALLDPTRRWTAISPTLSQKTMTASLEGVTRVACGLPTTMARRERQEPFPSRGVVSGDPCSANGLGEGPHVPLPEIPRAWPTISPIGEYFILLAASAYDSNPVTRSWMRDRHAASLGSKAAPLRIDAEEGPKKRRESSKSVSELCWRSRSYIASDWTCNF